MFNSFLITPQSEILLMKIINKQDTNIQYDDQKFKNDGELHSSLVILLVARIASIEVDNVVILSSITLLWAYDPI